MEEVVKLRTNMIGFKMNCFKKKNLRGFFQIDGRDLTDKEVRSFVNYCIDKGYKTDADCPECEIIKAITYRK